MTAIQAGAYFITRVPFDCTLTSWYLGGLPSGNITIDVSTATTCGGTFTSISGANDITMTGATDANDTDISDWTLTTILRGTWIKFFVTSATTCTYAIAQIEVLKQ
jgi:hypothetical protein